MTNGNLSGDAKLIPYTQNSEYGNNPAVDSSASFTAATIQDLESLRRNVNDLLRRVIILESKIK